MADVADRAFLLPPGRRGIFSLTAANDGLTGELGARLWQSGSLSVAGAAYGHEAWPLGGIPTWGVRLEGRF